MPTQNLMTPDFKGTQYRWLKTYKKQRYEVKCRDLGLPESQWNERQSAAAANEWWIKTKAAIDLSAVDPRIEEAAAEIAARIEWANQNEPCLVPELRAKQQAIAKAPADQVLLILHDNPQARAEAKKLLANKDKMPGILEGTLTSFFDGRAAWKERTKKVTVKAEHDTAKVLDLFLEVAGTQQKHSTFKQQRDYLKKLVAEGVLPADINKVTNLTVLAHHAYLKKQEIEGKSKNKRLGFFRRFIHWAYMNESLDVEPRNLKDPAQRFPVNTKRIKKYDNVKEVVESLSPKYKILALLSLNCGMTQVDLANLEWEFTEDSKAWVDIKTQTITRYRVKTEANPNSPIVTYKLWPETWKLLQEVYQSKGRFFLKLKSRGLEPEGNFVFLTRDGKKMYSNTKDNFTTNWKRFSGCPWPQGKFRKIGATALNTTGAYRGFIDVYLANEPGHIGFKHYAGESDKPFFEALDYLRKELLLKKE